MWTDRNEIRLDWIVRILNVVRNRCKMHGMCGMSLVSGWALPISSCTCLRMVVRRRLNRRSSLWRTGTNRVWDNRKPSQSMSESKKSPLDSLRANFAVSRRWRRRCTYCPIVFCTHDIIEESLHTRRLFQCLSNGLLDFGGHIRKAGEPASGLEPICTSRRCPWPT